MRHTNTHPSASPAKSAAPTYDDQACAQVTQAHEARTPDLHAVLRGNDTWTVVQTQPA